MASSNELKQMVTSFRVSELQVLLGYAGRSKSGKKHELMARSLQLVEKGCATPLQIKIRELYKRRFPAGAPSAKSSSPASESLKGSSARKDFTTQRGSITSGQPPGYPPPPYTSQNSTMNYGMSGANQIPVHPDVRFKQLPFFDRLGELLKPSSLMPRSSSRFQEIFFIFHLTPQQAQDVALSRTLSPHGIEDYDVQVQLRFCLLETSCEQKDEFPPSISVRINGKMAPLPNPIPTNKQGVEPKRPSRPVNITHICRLSPTVSNHINISWGSELGRSYCVGVDLVRKLNSDVLLQRTKSKGTKHSDFTTALIKEKLAHNPDSEITTTSLRCSLHCPLGKMRMSVPGRAITCNHVQSFDLPMFLQMNEKKPTWICPVCDRPAEFKNLIVDGLFTQILKTAYDASEIEFKEDGSWAPSKARDDLELCDSPDPVQMIGEEAPGRSADSEKQSSTDNSGPSAGASGDVIDLTESDDEQPPTTTLFSESSDSSSSSLLPADSPAPRANEEPEEDNTEDASPASESDEEVVAVTRTPSLRQRLAQLCEAAKFAGRGSENSPVVLFDDTLDSASGTVSYDVSPMCTSPVPPASSRGASAAASSKSEESSNISSPQTAVSSPMCWSPTPPLLSPKPRGRSWVRGYRFDPLPDPASLDMSIDATPPRLNAHGEEGEAGEVTPHSSPVLDLYTPSDPSPPSP